MPELALDLNQVISENSMIPYVSHFLPNSEVSSLTRVIMKGPVSKKEKLWPRIARRFCPICVEQDRELLGETFWRRNTAINGWNVCSFHGCYFNSITSRDQGLGNWKIFCAEELIPKKSQVAYATEDEIEIAKQCGELIVDTSVRFLDVLMNELGKRNLIRDSIFDNSIFEATNRFVRTHKATESFTIKYSAPIAYHLRKFLANQATFPYYIYFQIMSYVVKQNEMFRTFHSNAVLLDIPNDCRCGTTGTELLIIGRRSVLGKTSSRIISCKKCKFTVVEGKSRRIKYVGDHLYQQIKELRDKGTACTVISMSLKLGVNAVRRILRMGKSGREFYDHYLIKREKYRSLFLLRQVNGVARKSLGWLCMYDREWLISQNNYKRMYLD